MKNIYEQILDKLAAKLDRPDTFKENLKERLNFDSAKMKQKEDESSRGFYHRVMETCKRFINYSIKLMMRHPRSTNLNLKD